MLDTDIDALFDVAVAHLLVEDDAYGAGCDVIDDACLAMIDFVGLWRRRLASFP